MVAEDASASSSSSPSASASSSISSSVSSSLSSSASRMSFSDRQRRRKQHKGLKPDSLLTSSPLEDLTIHDDPSEGAGGAGGGVGSLAFRSHSFVPTNRNRDKESFSDRQKQRKAGELSIPDDVRPAIHHKMTGSHKVSFSDRQRQKKLGFSREREAVESLDVEYGSSWLILSPADSPSGSPRAEGGADSEADVSLPRLTAGAGLVEPGVGAISSGGGAVAAAAMVPVEGSRKMFQVRLGPGAKRLVSGAIAGGFSRTVVAPLETIRTHLMVGNTGKKSVGEVYHWILETEGWKGLFRGNALNVLRVTPAKAIELFTYDSVRKALTPKDGSQPRLPFPVSSIAGSSAGIASCIITYPLELVKTRLTVQPKDYSGVIQAFCKIVSEEGFAELYRGLTPSIVGVIPYAGTNYFAYDTLRNLYRKVTGKKRIEPLATLLIGSSAGAFAATATFPLEVARKQMQVGALQGRVAYKGTLDCIRCILRDQGIAGLYKGLVPSCLKLMPAAGISFMCYEILKKLLIEENE